MVAKKRTESIHELAVCDGMIDTENPCPVFHVKFVALAHNVVRGAAGAAILNAELMVGEGLI